MPRPTGRRYRSNPGGGGASFVPDRNSHHVTFWRTGVGLWVVIDEQFEDALRLPDDPGFMPARPLAP